MEATTALRGSKLSDDENGPEITQRTKKAVDARKRKIRRAAEKEVAAKVQSSIATQNAEIERRITDFQEQMRAKMAQTIGRRLNDLSSRLADLEWRMRAKKRADAKAMEVETTR
jgi:hypothetical protein